MALRRQTEQSVCISPPTTGTTTAAGTASATSRRAARNDSGQRGRSAARTRLRSSGLHESAASTPKIGAPVSAASSTKR